MTADVFHSTSAKAPEAEHMLVGRTGKGAAAATVMYALPDLIIPPVAIGSGNSLASPGGSFRRSRWSAAVLGSLAIHTAVVGALLTNWSVHRSEDKQPPAAMTVELAIMPSSLPGAPSEIPPGPQQIEGAPKPTVRDEIKFDPPPQVDPTLQPDFVLPVKKQDQPVEARIEANDARETTAPQSVQAPAQDKSAAPVEGNHAAPPSDVQQAWEGRILAKLERNKRYPLAAQNAGQQDTVFVRMVIDRKGKLIDATIKKSAGFASLDRETLALAMRASPFPAPPDSASSEQIVLIVPVEFYIKKWG